MGYRGLGLIKRKTNRTKKGELRVRGGGVISFHSL